MATTYYQERRGDSNFLRSVQWKKALQAAGLVGAVLFLLSRGIPWVGSGAINPAIMGREVNPGHDPGAMGFLTVFMLHMALSVIYGLIIVPIVHGFRHYLAGAVGAVIGLVLYFMSYAVAGMLTDAAVTQREWPAVVLHITFGLFVAEAYKGMAKRRSAPVL